MEAGKPDTEVAIQIIVFGYNAWIVYKDDGKRL